MHWFFEPDLFGASLALMNAIEKSNKIGVEEALRAGANANSTVGNQQNTALHLAIRTGNDEIAALLIGHNADVNQCNKLGRSPLHEAARAGSLRMVRQLLPQGAMVNAADHEKWTPLHFAAEKGHKKIVECLLANGADYNLRNTDENSPLHIAAMFAHEMVAELLIDKGADAVCLNNDGKSPVKIMTEKYFDSKFFFRVISLQAESDILAQMNSPIRFVNQIMKEHHNELSYLANEVYTMLLNQDPKVVRYLLVWYNSLRKAARVHGHEKVDLQAAADLIESAVNEIFSCDSMDDPRNVQCILQPTNKALNDPKQREGFEGHTLNERRELFRCQITSFNTNGVLSLCLKHKCKFIFGRQQISGFISVVFKTPARAVLYKKNKPALEDMTAAMAGDDHLAMPKPTLGLKDEYSAQIPFIAKIENRLHFNIFDPHLFGLSYSLRSCPVAMFGMELISKVFTVAVIAWVSVSDYGRKYKTDYHFGDYSDEPITSGEILLSILMFSNLFYELGQLAEEDWKISRYLKDQWNMVDTLCMVVLIVWFVTRMVLRQNAVARIVLALVAIPESSGALRYLSVSKTLGVIVATTSAMFKDLLAFFAVYIVCVTGFGIFFFALFYGNSSFSSVPKTMSQMFQYTLTSFDFESFDSTSSLVNALAQVVLAIYLILTAVLLLNLLIARMTNAYQRVDDKALQEWSFAKTQTVLEHLLLRERHVFCMLPSPFNLIPTLTYPFHYFLLEHTGISLAGTVSNLVMAYIGGPIRVYSLLYCFRTGMTAILHRAYTKNKSRPLLAAFVLIVVFIFGCVVATYLTIHVVWFYPLFAWGDLTERVDRDGTLSYVSDGPGGRQDEPEIVSIDDSMRESETL